MTVAEKPFHYASSDIYHVFPVIISDSSIVKFISVQSEEYLPYSFEKVNVFPEVSLANTFPPRSQS